MRQGVAYLSDVGEWADSPPSIQLSPKETMLLRDNGLRYGWPGFTFEQVYNINHLGQHKTKRRILAKLIRHMEANP